MVALEALERRTTVRSEGWSVAGDDMTLLPGSATFPHPRKRTRGKHEAKSVSVVVLSIEQLLSIAYLQATPSSTAPVSDLPHVDLRRGSVTLKENFSHPADSHLGD